MSFYRKYEIETLQKKLFWKLLEKYSEDNEAMGTKCWRLSGIAFCFSSKFEWIVIGTWLIKNDFGSNFQNALILYSYYYQKCIFCYYFPHYHYYYYYYHYQNYHSYQFIVFIITISMIILVFMLSLLSISV